MERHGLDDDRRRRQTMVFLRARLRTQSSQRRPRDSRRSVRPTRPRVPTRAMDRGERTPKNSLRARLRVTDSMSTICPLDACINSSFHSSFGRARRRRRDRRRPSRTRDGCLDGCLDGCRASTTTARVDDDRARRIDDDDDDDDGVRDRPRLGETLARDGDAEQ